MQKCLSIEIEFKYNYFYANKINNHTCNLSLTVWEKIGRLAW